PRALRAPRLARDPVGARARDPARRAGAPGAAAAQRVPARLRVRDRPHPRPARAPRGRGGRRRRLALDARGGRAAGAARHAAALRPDPRARARRPPLRPDHGVPLLPQRGARPAPRGDGAAVRPARARRAADLQQPPPLRQRLAALGGRAAPDRRAAQEEAAPLHVRRRDGAARRGPRARDRGVAPDRRAAGAEGAAPAAGPPPHPPPRAHGEPAARPAAPRRHAHRRVHPARRRAVSRAGLSERSGPAGGGKTTVAELVDRALAERGVPHVGLAELEAADRRFGEKRITQYNFPGKTWMILPLAL